MDSWSDYYQRRLASQQAIGLEEQSLYEHLLECVRVEAPETLLARFRMLFVNGVEYSDYQVWQALKKIVESPFVEKDFKFILNRSSHIFINHWLMQPQLHKAIPELIALFEIDPVGPRKSRMTQRLRELMQDFRQTEQYKALKRLSHVVNQSADGTTRETSLETLTRRYPYLYRYNLLTADSTDEHRHQVRKIKRRVQHQFERDLAQYVVYKRKEGEPAQGSQSVSKSFCSPKNPTLLSDRHLDRALQQFGGKVDGSNTCRDLAQCFLTYSHGCTYRVFKQNLYDYLVSSISAKYGSAQFNQRLCNYLESILPEHDEQPLNDILLISTCCKLLNFLVVEHTQSLNHAVLVDLIGNLGITSTIGLLLKIVLLCRKVKPYLEKQFAILFKHYETCTHESVLWLVDSLENLNVAFSINFGTLTL